MFSGMSAHCDSDSLTPARIAATWREYSDSDSAMAARIAAARIYGILAKSDTIVQK